MKVIVCKDDFLVLVYNVCCDIFGKVFFGVGGIVFEITFVFFLILGEVLGWVVRCVFFGLVYCF